MSEKEKMEHKKKKELSLLGIFGEEALKELLNTMSAAMDFSFSVIDYRGKTLIDSTIQNEYCMKYMNQPQMCGECQISAAFAAAKAAIKCGPYIYSCPRGFISIAVPVIVNDQYLGAIVGGRVRCEEELLGAKETGIQSRTEWDAEEKELFRSVPELTSKKLLAIADLMFFLLQEMGEKETLELQQEKQERTQTHLRDIRKKNEILKKDLMEMENHSLKARILPHFLLDLFIAVSNVAILENAVQTQEFMTDIASVLRYYVDEATDFIPMEKELKQMENYLEILKKQFGDRIDYKMTYGDFCLTRKIPFLSLFPFLNYIINFGMMPGHFQGTLILNVEESGNRCFITMKLDDEDVSVHKRVIAGHMEEIADQEELLEQIKNTKRRLNYIYGDDYQVRMQPDLVVIDLPKLHDINE